MAEFAKDPRSAEGVSAAPASRSPDHERVARNVAALVDRSLETRRPCRAVRDGRVRLPPDAGGEIYAPDVLVTCEPMDSRAASDAPWLVAEVEDRDHPRAVLVPGYAAIPSVREVWVVSSYSRVAMVWHKTDAGWRTTLPFIDDQSFPSHVLGVEVTLGAIYALTTLDAVPAEDGEAEGPGARPLAERQRMKSELASEIVPFSTTSNSGAESWSRLPRTVVLPPDAL